MDAELQALREARLAELKRGTSAESTPVGASVSGYLEPQALERLSRVSLVRPDRAAAVEKYLAQLASTGQLRGKVSERDIVQILDRIAREKETKIIFDRRDGNDEEDDEEDDGDDFFD